VSRAFVKDDDDRPEPEPGRPISDRPNYVTPKGFAHLHELLTVAKASGNDRDARYYDDRIEHAIVVDPASQPRDIVAFGATVGVRDERGVEMRVHIVGEDESNPAKGAVSWSAPFVQALLTHGVGERVVVQRPAGPARIEILSIDYED
jgi:transcription elongation GreA/GreB family factor